jgi:hypothetical protein
VRRGAGELGAAAAAELTGVDAHQLTAALRRTAARLALLHTGQVGAALAAAVAGDPRLAQAPRSVAVDDPDLRDLAAFALSEPYLELRTAAEGAA